MLNIGIDIGGTSAKVGLVDESGKILCKASVKTGEGVDPTEMIRALGEFTLNFLKEQNVSLDEIASIGVGVPGLADSNGNVIFCANLKWTNVPFRTEMQKYINKPVFVDNDATVAGLAEFVCGGGAGSSSSIFITLGTGVGAGIILNGKVWNGFHGIGGELGHTLFREGGELCNCGNRGCMERYCSATAIIQMAKKELPDYPDSLVLKLAGGDPEQIGARQIFDAAKENDELGLKIFRQYVTYLAEAIASIVMFIDPEAIILGGGVSAAGSFLLDAVRAEIPEHLIFKTQPFSRIELATLGNDAGIIGAAMLSTHA